MAVDWKPVTGYEGSYIISNDGRLWSCLSRSYKKPSLDKDGYLITRIYRNGISKNAKLHRLVALAFMPTDNTDLTINHINGEKQDNRIVNLEWMDRGTNARIALQKEVVLLNPEGNLVTVDCMRQFCRDNGLCRGHLHEVKVGRRRHHKGWRYP